MQFQPVGAIFQHIVDAHGPAGQLPRLAHRHEALAQGGGQRRAQDEAARLDADDQVGIERPCHASQPLDQFGEARTVRQQRGDVAELDAGLGEIRNGADEGGQAVDAHGISIGKGRGSLKEPRPSFFRNAKRGRQAAFFLSAQIF